MKKTTETYYCDCCNKQFDRFATRFVNGNHYKVASFTLPILIEADVEEFGNNEKIDYQTIELHDVCDDCMKKLIKFSNELVALKIDSFK